MEKKAPMMLRAGRGGAGFSLIEILVSVAILAGALALILQGLVRGAYALSVAKHRLQAYAFSTAKMAEVELLARTGEAPTTEGSFRAGRDNFAWQLQAAPISDSDRLELVTLIVNWRQGQRPYDVRTSLLRRLPVEPKP